MVLLVPRSLFQKRSYIILPGTRPNLPISRNAGFEKLTNRPVQNSLSQPRDANVTHAIKLRRKYLIAEVCDLSNCSYCLYLEINKWQYFVMWSGIGCYTAKNFTNTTANLYTARWVQLIKPLPASINPFIFSFNWGLIATVWNDCHNNPGINKR